MKKLTSLFASAAGFTMIELLIVITILGILAVAVLSAINPVEQINRGRDTGSKSDAEQLLGAMDRYYAFQGYYPWQTGATDTNTDIAFQVWDGGITDSGGTCTLTEKLSQTTNVNCTGTDELKVTFFNRIEDATYNSLWVYNEGDQGDSTYVCFVPKSRAFLTEAKTRCVDANGSGLPNDIDGTTAATICATDNEYVCLP